MLTIAPFEGGYMSNRPYSTNVLDFIPQTLRERARKWPLMGAEIELPEMNQRTAARGLEGAAIVKDDGSIPDEGGEIVFIPMTYKQLRARFVSLAADTGTDPARFHSACGTHIHLSPAWRVETRDLADAFARIPAHTLDALASRGATEYCRRGDDIDSHYSAVSRSQRFGTIEVRHAQGMTCGWRLGAWIDTVYGLAKALRNGKMLPSEAARFVIETNPTADMRRAIREGVPEMEEAGRYCEGCAQTRDEDSFECDGCRQCSRCCECSSCNRCDARSYDLSLCGDCEACDACCDCPHCADCGEVYDDSQECYHEGHAGYCESCCDNNTCYECENPLGWSDVRVRDGSTNYRTYCAGCAEPIRIANAVERAVSLAVNIRAQRAFVGPRRERARQAWDRANEANGYNRPPMTLDEQYVLDADGFIAEYRYVMVAPGEVLL